MAATPVTYTYAGEIAEPSETLGVSVYTCSHCAALVTFGSQATHSKFHANLYTALRRTLDVATGP